jgi:hypothetical protein
MLRKLNLSMVIAAFSLAAGCVGGGGGSGTGTGSGTGDTGGVTTPGDSLGLAGGGSTAGGMGNTFDHDNDGLDPFAVLQRVQEQGPPEISTKMHSCQKLKYATLGNVLKQLGVNLASATANSAGLIYKNGSQPLGAPNYGARVAEAIEQTTSGATKLFDVFVTAAPEIIAAIPNVAKKGGVAIQMFDAAGNCTADGIAFLQGAPSTQAQVDLCNNALTSASTPAIGKTIAVATILAAAGTCE